MSDKKIIIIALILSALIAGGGWYYSIHQPPTAAIGDPPSNLEAGISYGNPAAPVLIEEYFSYLCSACVRFGTDIFPLIEEDYIKTGKVRFIFYPFPPYELGGASFCSQKAGKFSEYHYYLLKHSGNIQAIQDLIDFAVNTGLNQDEFTQCLNSDEAKKVAQYWHEQGIKRGVDATPTFFINSQKFIGVQPYSEFKKLIEEKLNQTE